LQISKATTRRKRLLGVNGDTSFVGSSPRSNPQQIPQIHFKATEYGPIGRIDIFELGRPFWEFHNRRALIAEPSDTQVRLLRSDTSHYW
jgi:hypothetical protein